MADTLIVQSYRTHDVAPWLVKCMASVRAWAGAMGYAYEFVDDRLFDPVPPWYRERCGRQLLPVTDLARLLLIQERFAGGWPRVAWIDADILVFDPRRFRIDISGDAAFCRELWIHRDSEGRPLARFCVNNSVIVMKAGTPMLAFLIYADQQIVRNTPPERIDHNIVGTLFLTRLSEAVPLEILINVGMLSPSLTSELAAGGEELCRLFATRFRNPIAAANLCASLSGVTKSGVCVGEVELARVVELLTASRGAVINRHLGAQ